MADIGSEVHITGTDLPLWASEKTLSDLLEQIEKLTGTSEEQKRILDKSFREIQKTGKATTKGIKGAGTGGGGADPKSMSAFTTGLKKAGGEALDTAAGFDKLGGPMKNFGKALKKSSTSMKVGLAAVGGIFALLGKGAAIYLQNLNSITALTDSGIILEDSYLGIQRTLAMTGMSLDQFNELTQKYTRVIGQNGLRAFTNFVRQTDKAADGFDRFGLTTADATEYAAEYLDQQRMVGVFRGSLERKQAVALAENMAQLTAYSKVLNVSRDDLQATSREMMSNADLQAELFSMDTKTREAAQEAFRKTALALGALGPAGDELSQKLTDIAASPNPYGSASYIQLVENGQTELANSLVAMAAANKRGEETSLAEIKSKLALTDAQIENQRAFRLVNGSMRDEAVLRINLAKAVAEADANEISNRIKFGKTGKKGEEAWLIWLASVDKNAEGAASIVDGANKMRATAERGLVEAMDKVIVSFAGKNGIGKAADSVGTVLRKMADDANLWIDKFHDSKDPIGMVMGLVGDILKGGWDMIVAAITAGFQMLAENTITGKIGRGFSSAAHWLGGTDAEAEIALGGRDAELAAARQEQAGFGGSPSRMKSFGNNQILKYDIQAQASRLNRRESDNLGDKGAAAITAFEERMLQLTKKQQADIAKMLAEIRGGAFGRQ